MTGGAIRASDADRDQVSDVLHAAYAEGRITHEELGERTTAVLQARTFDDLVPLTADLMPTAPAAPPERAGVPATTDQAERVIAILSTTKRVGRWRVSPVTSASAVLGEVLIDLTEATFESRRIEVDCSQFMGSTKIRVPIGTNVTLDTTNILAEASVRGIGAPDPEMPTVVVTGVNVLGEILIRGPKKSLPWNRHVA